MIIQKVDIARPFLVINPYKIRYDGNSIWINTTSCIGRYVKSKENFVTKELFLNWKIEFSIVLAFMFQMQLNLCGLKSDENL